MKNEKGLLIAHCICITFSLFLMAALRAWENSPSGTFFEAGEDMDNLESQCDNDGYLIMVSTKDALVGAYWCSTPLKHYWCRVCVNVALPQTYTVDQIENIGIEMKLEDLWDIYKLVPSGTPLLLY